MVRAAAHLDDMVLCEPVLLVPLLLTPGLVQHLQIDNVRRRPPGYDAMILVLQPPVSTTTHPQRGRRMQRAQTDSRGLGSGSAGVAMTYKLGTLRKSTTSTLSASFPSSAMSALATHIHCRSEAGWGRAHDCSC